MLELKNTESLIELFWYSLSRLTLVFILLSSVKFKDFSQSLPEIFEIFLNFCLWKISDINNLHKYLLLLSQIWFAGAELVLAGR